MHTHTHTHTMQFLENCCVGEGKLGAHFSFHTAGRCEQDDSVVPTVIALFARILWPPLHANVVASLLLSSYPAIAKVKKKPKETKNIFYLFFQVIRKPEVTSIMPKHNNPEIIFFFFLRKKKFFGYRRS